MTKATDITKFVDPVQVLRSTLGAITSQAIEAILAGLPIVPETDYSYNPKNPAGTWQSGKLHWYPVGNDGGNAGRIKLANSPENPIGERIINAIEALIELERHKELMLNPNAPYPSTPRDAVGRYFDLPSLGELPFHDGPIRGEKLSRYVSSLASRIKVLMRQQAKGKEYTVIIEDDGIGQTATRMHETLLSLGCSDKPDKPYLIGMFGQGGSSAFAASNYSWLVSRRAPDLPDHKDGGIGWTIVRRIMPPGRRGYVFWAYLAAHPDGSVPKLPESAADALGLSRGTRIGHVGYKFATSNQAYGLYTSLNHLLFNPVLPYYVVTRKDKATGRDRPDLMSGNAYRLSKLYRDDEKELEQEKKKVDLNKRFDNVSV